MSERYYVYAIAASERRLPEGVSGFCGPLLILPYRELGVVASRIRAAEMEESISSVSAENLLRHEAVVEAVCAGGPALPVRFGTVLPDDQAVRRAVAGQYDALRDDLQRIGDKIELGVTALWQRAKGQADTPTSDPAPCGHSSADPVTQARRPGLAYLRARQTEYRQAQVARERAQALGRELDSALRPYVFECRRVVCPSERLALRDLYLLERERQRAFEMAFAEVRQRHQEVKFLLSGPWPPYSFVTPPARDAVEIPQSCEKTSRIE